MAMVPFYTEFPEIALKEARRITLEEEENSLIPAGAYLFLESYCDEQNCDCRRVIVNIVSESKPRSILAAINYGWETPEFYKGFLHTDDDEEAELAACPTLQMLHTQSNLAEELLSIFNKQIQDEAYKEKLRDHYAMFKQAINNKNSAVNKEKDLYGTKISRNAPCPCGSGKKYKKCCLNKDTGQKSFYPEQFKTNTPFDIYMEIFKMMTEFWQAKQGDKSKDVDEFYEEVFAIEKRFRPGQEDGIPDSMFMSWAYLDFYFGEDNKTVCERFLESEYVKKSPPIIGQKLVDLQKSYFTFYRIRACSDKCIFMEESGTGKIWQVLRMDELFGLEVKIGDIYFTRLVGIYREAYMFSVPYIFPDLSKNDVKCIAEEQKQQAYDMFDSGELSEEEIFRKSGKLLLWGWMKSILGIDDESSAGDSYSDLPVEKGGFLAGDEHDYKEIMREFYARISRFIEEQPGLLAEMREKEKFFKFLEMEEEAKKKIFFDWFIFDYKSEVLKENILRCFLRTVSLDEKTEELYRAFIDNIYSEFEVKALKTGKEMVLYDLVNDKEYKVTDTTLTKDVKKEQCGFVRIIPFENYYILTGVGYFFPAEASMLIKLSAQNLKNLIDHRKPFKLTPLLICEIFFSQKPRERLPLEERFMFFCREAGLEKEYIEQILKKLKLRAEQNGHCHDIIEEVFKKIKPYPEFNPRELTEVFNNVWNSFVSQNKDYCETGPMEKSLIGICLDYVQSKADPEKYKDVKDAAPEAQKLQEEWFKTAFQELGGSTPEEVILKEREKMGNPRKDIKFEINIAKLNPGQEIELKARELFDKGLSFLNENKPKEAIEAYEQYLYINPKNYVVWHNKGFAHTLLLDKKTATECYRRALEIKPDYAMAKEKLKFLKKARKADMEYIAKEYKSRISKQKRKAGPAAKSGKIKSSQQDCIYQIKITLKDVKPLVWRRILVKPDINLFTLHVILQEVMGWDGGHLHQFFIDGQYYGRPDPEFDITAETINEKKVKLKDVIKQEKQKFKYEYDFGDDWKHELIIEKILPMEKGKYYPVCIAGARACPPEDCGGPWGYENFLMAIMHPNHAEHEETLEWIGGSFDPEEFDIEAINEALKDIKSAEKMHEDFE